MNVSTSTHEKRSTHLIIGNTDSGYGIRVSPHSILHELHSLLLLVLTTITKGFPVLLPFSNSGLQILCKVGKVTLIRLNRLLRPLQLDLNLLQFLPLHKPRLSRV